MKKLIVTTLCVAMCLSLAACGDTKSETTRNNATTENTVENTTEGITEDNAEDTVGNTTEDVAENTTEDVAEDSTQANENPTDGATSVEIPEILVFDKDNVENIAGTYFSFTDDSSVEVKLDASTADSSVGTVVGNSTINCEQFTYSGDLEKVATNVYRLNVDDADVFLGFFFETTGDTKVVSLHLVIDDQEVNWYRCSEE